jgi:DNA repair exonuclease SbcCD ATPase subunit
VVPQTGGTAKYSEILGFEAKEKRRLAASAHGENPDMFEDPENGDDFVDAREHPEPSSPNRSRTSGKSGRNVKELENVVEELSLENKTLKDCLDAMSRRLHTFESAAQQSTLALQESIRMFRPTSPAAVPRQGSGGGEELKKMERRLRALEDKSAADAEKLARMQKEGEKLQKENEKLKSTLSKYRERWEQLKAGAKTRREAAATGSRDSGPSGGATDASPNVRYMAG